MAKYKVLKNFKGLKEKKRFKAGEEIDLTVKRADEIVQNIEDNFGVTDVLERIEEKAANQVENDGEEAEK